MSEASVYAAALSDVGRARQNNEDAFTVTDATSGERLDAANGPWTISVGPRGVLLALSDGMGGHAAGEVASALVIDALRAGLAADAGGEHVRLIREAVTRANGAVIRVAEQAGKQGMGATLTVVLVLGREALVGQVGDSRAYLLRSGEWHQLTHDQSFVQALVDNGTISAEEARDSGRKNMLLQAIGSRPEVKVAIGRLRLRRGDRFLLCCDGLSNAVTDRELAQTVATSDAPAACRALVDLANERGGKDNLTAVVAWVDGSDIDEPRTAETFDQTFEVLEAFSPSVP